MRLASSLLRQGSGARVASFAVALRLRASGATWRIRTQGDDPFAGGSEPAIAALWHRSLLVAAFLLRGRRIAVPVSLSRDGDFTPAGLQRLRRPAPGRGGPARPCASEAGTAPSCPPPSPGCAWSTVPRSSCRRAPGRRR